MDYDAIVIGSGFGGSILARRLGEQMAVLVLERGRRWAPEDYPSVKHAGSWEWKESDSQENGLFDVRSFRHISIVTGAGVGGGSHVYSGVHVRADDFVLKAWPGGITADSLSPYYQRVEEMLRIGPVPPNQYPPRTELVRDVAQSIGAPERFTPVPLAISFDESFVPDPGADPRTLIPRAAAVPLPAYLTGIPAERRSRYQQKSCVHLSDCNLGCPVRAKNTLDLNYLADAEENHGVEVRPLQLVQKITMIDGGYAVSFSDRSAAGAVESATARRVFVCAGSVGSTELLLRCRDQYGTLPSVGAALGTRWGPNGDFHTPAYFPSRMIHNESGPVTTAALDFRDAGAPAGVPVFLQDVGLPSALRDVLSIHGNPFGPDHPILHNIVSQAESLNHIGQLSHFLDWFGPCRDASDGTFSLAKDKDGAWQLALDWSAAQSDAVFEKVSDLQKLATHKSGGIPLGLWPLVKSLMASHPLGGCRMAGVELEGVVDSYGKVFHYDDLYVCDGAIVPSPTVANPSHTIAALAERLAEHVLAS